MYEKENEIVYDPILSKKIDSYQYETTKMLGQTRIGIVLTDSTIGEIQKVIQILG